MQSEKKVKNIKVLSNVTLESSEASTQAAASREIVDSYLSDQVNLIVQYTTGSGETATECIVKLWGYVGSKSESTSSPYSSAKNSEIGADTDNWIQLGTYDLSSGVATFTATEFKVAGGASATTYTAHFAHGITFSKIRVSAYETGVSANKGTISAIVCVQ